MTAKIIAAAAMALTAAASAANAATVTLDFEGIVPAGVTYSTFATGTEGTFEEGLTVTVTSGTVYLDTPAFHGLTGVADALYVGAGSAIDVAAGGGVFDLTSVTALGDDFDAVTFSLRYERADGTLGLTTYAVTDPQVLALNLTDIVKATLSGLTGVTYIDEIVTAVPSEAVPLPAAALLFGPAVAGMAFARRRAAG